MKISHRFLVSLVLICIGSWMPDSIFPRTIAPVLAARSFREVALPSGRTLHLFAMGPMFFADGKSKALMLQYQSQYKIADKASLEKEVADIWALFRRDVEKADYTTGIISALEVSEPNFIGFSQEKGYNFVFEKQPDGNWRALDNANIVEPDLLNRKSHELLAKQDYRNAITALNKLVELWPKSAECLINRGGAHLALKEYKDALQDCDKGIALDPKAMLGYVNRGFAYARLKDTSRALADYNKALTVNPALNLALLNRGELYLELGKTDEAIKDLSEAIKVSPEIGEAYFYRSRAYKKKGDLKAAEKDSAQAKALKYYEGKVTMVIK